MKNLYVLFLVACIALAGQTAGWSRTGSDQENPRDMEQVREKMASVLTVVKDAYARLLAESPQASGDITVGFAITPEGSVTDVNVTCSPDVESLHDLVAEAVAGLDFGASATQRENIPVTAPISLAPPR